MTHDVVDYFKTMADEAARHRRLAADHLCLSTALSEPHSNSCRAK